VSGEPDRSQIVSDEAGHHAQDRDESGRTIEEHRLRQQRYVAPSSEVERYLAAVWAELLVADRIGAEDDFFEAGGHSLLMFRLQRRIRKELEVHLEFPDMLANSRLCDLAKLVEQQRVTS
jgi:hypothetical protein